MESEKYIAQFAMEKVYVNTNDRKINAKIVGEDLTAFIRNKNKIVENAEGTRIANIAREKLTVNHVEAKMYANLIGVM